MKLKSRVWKVVLAAAALICSTGTFAQKHWVYEGDEGTSTTDHSIQ